MGHRPWVRLLTKPNSRSICHSSPNFVDLSDVNIYTAERSFSCMKRLQTPLRRTTTDERLSSLAILHMSTFKHVIDIDGIITEFGCLKGTHLVLCL